MNKEELKDAIASGSCLRKADAGRFSNPALSNSTDPRSALAEVAASWNQLTEAEQQTWNDAAVNFPAKNKYGDIYTPSGYQVFMKLNSNLRLVFEPQLKVAPNALFPVLPEINYIETYTDYQLMFNFAGGIPEDQSILVYACAMVPQGSGFRKGKEKLLMAAPPNPTGIIDCTYLYQNIFGKVKRKSIIYFRFVAVSNLSGQLSVEKIVKVNIKDFAGTPVVGFNLSGVYSPAVSVGKDWIIPFRAFGFNLTENMVLNTPVDPADRFKISRSLDGPWVNTLNVPLNELKQPKQNVFYFKITIAAPGLGGTVITSSSTGATDAQLGMAMQAIDQFIGDPTATIAFGDVYSGLYTPKEVAMNYGALRGNIDFILSGANADRFQVSNSEFGPWSNATTLIISGTGSDPNAKIWVRSVPGATGALTAQLNASSAGDIAPHFDITANVIDASITSPDAPNISYGAAITGERNEGVFHFSAAGINTSPAILADGLVNCTIEFTEVIHSVYSNPLPVPGAVPPTVVNKAIYYNIIPTAAGIFSGNIHIVAGGGGLLDFTFDGVGS